jgi:hypothetical protein
LRLRLRPKTPPPEGLPAETPIPFSNPPIEPSVAAPSEEIPPTEAPATADIPANAPVADLSVQETPAQETQPEPVVEPVAEPEPVLESPPMPVPEPVVPEPVYVAPPPPVVPPDISDVHAPTPPPTIKADKWLAGIVALVVVLAAAFWGMHALFKANPKAKPVGKLPSSHVAEKSEPKTETAQKPHLVENPKSEAGKKMARARDVVAANDRRVGGLEEVEESQAKPAPATTATEKSAAAVSEAKPAVEEPPAAPQPEPPPPASDDFKHFVAGLRVNGVFQGENARAMLNGKTYNIGDVVDVKLNITFFKVDADAKQLIFRDDTGATVSRRY